jgi:putative ABC transport system permease protein
MSAGEKWWPFFRREDTREQINRNIGAEFDAHLELRIEQLKAEGWSEEEARARAEALLGDAGRASRICERTDHTWLLRDRAAHFFGSILSDACYALRLFRTSPLFACMASLCLAVGITFITTTYTILDDTVLHPLPYEDADELVMVGRDDTILIEMNFIWSSYPDFLDWDEQNHVFEQMATMSWDIYALTDPDDPQRIFGSSVSPDFLSLLRVTPLLGRGFVPDDYLPGAEPVVLIGYGLWQRAYGGDPAIVGHRMTMNGQEGWQVVGVMPPGFSFPSYQEAWTPLRRDEPGPRSNTSNITVGRLRDGTSIEAAEAEMRQIQARLVEAYPDQYPADGPPSEIQMAPFGSFLFRAMQSPFLIIFIVGCLVLLLTCSNLANLALSRAADRTRELSVRAVLGAGRGRLVQQVIIENLLIALAGGVIGIGLGHLCLRLLFNHLPFVLPRYMQFDINLRVLAALIGIVMLSGVLFGLAPAFAVRRNAPGASLRSDSTRMSPGRKHTRIRSSLVVLQIGLATIILAVTGVMMKSYLESQARRVGVDTEHLLGQYMGLPVWDYRTPESWVTFFQTGVERLRSRPGIEAAAFISQAPAARTEWTTSICTNETAADSEQPFLVSRVRTISSGYFDTARIPLLSGRDFNSGDSAEGQRVCIVSRTLARTLWGEADPVGRSLYRAREPDPERMFQVVGMVEDVRYGGPGTEAGLCFYLPLSLTMPRTDGWFLVRSSGKPRALASVLRTTIREIEPHLAMSPPRTVTELAWERNWRTIIVTWIITVIAFFALLLALVGIIGIVACEVSNRRHEFGIRMALGADSRSILRTVLTRGGSMAGIGIGAGLVVTLAAMRLLSSMATGLDTGHPMVLVGVIVFLITTTLLASYLPARRIMRIDPVEVLREE